MNVIDFKELPNTLKAANALIDYVDLENRFERNLLKSLSGHEKFVVDTLNLINNQNIESIDFDKRKYTVDGLAIDIEFLATSKSLFAVALAANLSKSQIYIGFDMDQLTEGTLKLFVELFGKSNYITLVCRGKADLMYYTSMCKEA
jgi:hypothetical protein